MHEWLEALQKSAKAAAPGVAVDEVRRAETECGIPFPTELAALYRTVDGGTFLGEVVLFPLHAAEGQPSVLEKSRLMLVGLPAAGVWRFGLKGAHRHLFAARKSAMVEQGDGGGALPGWVEALEDEAWVYGTWEHEEKEMRLYRSLAEMLEVLVPPAEERESFGERTYARALSAVEGALSVLATGGDEEEAETSEEDVGASPGLSPELEDALDELEAGQEDEEEALEDERELAERGLEREETVSEAIRRLRGRAAPVSEAPEEAEEEAPARPAVRKAGGRKAAKKAAAKRAPARKAAAKKGGTRKAAAKKGGARKAAAKKGGARKAARKTGVRKAAAKKGGARKAAAKKGARKAAGKRGAARRKR